MSVPLPMRLPLGKETRDQVQQAANIRIRASQPGIMSSKTYTVNPPVLNVENEIRRDEKKIFLDSSGIFFICRMS